MITRVEEWNKSICQEHNCKHYSHNDYPYDSYCTCPDNCIVYGGKKNNEGEKEA